MRKCMFWIQGDVPTPYEHCGPGWKCFVLKKILSFVQDFSDESTYYINLYAWVDEGSLPLDLESLNSHTYVET